MPEILHECHCNIDIYSSLGKKYDVCKICKPRQGKRRLPTHLHTPKSLRHPYGAASAHWLFTEHRVKAVAGLSWSEGGSESSLGTHTRKPTFLWRNLYDYVQIWVSYNLMKESLQTSLRRCYIRWVKLQCSMGHFWEYMLHYFITL